MEQQSKAASGYVIIVTLLVISLAVALLSAIVQQTFSYNRQYRMSVDRSRARMLALSSLEIAASQVSQVIYEDGEKAPSKDEGQQKKTQDVLEPLQSWLLKILPILNRWQTIELKDVSLGLEGTVKIYIVCEQGKINLASFEKELEGDTSESMPSETKKPGPAAQTTSQQIRRGSLAALDEFFKKEKEVSIKDTLMQFRQKFMRMPEDPTELLRIKQFEKLRNIIFMPPEEVKKQLSIMDLFTVRSGEGKLNPWLLSRSVKTLIGLKEKGDAKIDKDFVKDIKPSMQWSTDWDNVLAQRYGKNFAAFEKDIQDMFASEFEAKAFSVVSYSTVGSVTQKLYALLELTDPGQGISPKSLIFKVSKLYWL